jgi:hypothetical protein
MSTTNVAPTQSQAPTDPRLAALQAQTAILAQQQQQMDATLKIQQDRQGMLTSMLPASSTAPLSGAFTPSGSNPFDSQKLAYEVLEKVAMAVAEKVTATGPVLIYDQTEINSLVNYKAVLKILKAAQDQVALLTQTFDNTLGPEIAVLMARPRPAVPPAQMGIVPVTLGVASAALLIAPAALGFAPILIPGLLLGGLKTLSDLMGMFRTNTSIAFSSFTADDVALTAAVVNALIAKGKTVYEPAVMPIEATDDASPFMQTLTKIENDLLHLQEKATVGQAKLQQLSDALGAFIQADQAVQANSDMTKTAGLNEVRLAMAQFAQGLFTNPADPAPAPLPLDGATANALKSVRDQFLKELGLFVTSVSTMVTTFNALQASLMAVTNTGSATLTAILRAEKLMNKVKADGATILLVKTSVLGGSVVTRVNLFTGGHLLYTGGAIANYTMFDSTGKVTGSGLVAGNTAEKKAKL